MAEHDHRAVKSQRRHLRQAAKSGAAEPRLGAVDQDTHALPRLFHRAVEGGRALGFARQRHRQRMPARQRQPRRHLQQIGRDLRRIGDARLRQRERAGLVENDGVGFRQPLDGIAGVEDDVGAEQRAGRDYLHGGNCQRQRAGAGDDEDGDGGHHRVVQRGAGDQPADAGQRGSQVHHGRIDTGGAVGEPAGARLGAGRFFEQPLDLVDQRILEPAAVTRTVSAPE